MERLADFAYLCFALGFFMFTMWFVKRQNDVDYERTLNERREFGYGNGTKYHPFRRIRDPDDQ